MADEAQVFAWAPKDQTIRSTRDNGAFHVTGDRVGQVGIAFVQSGAKGVNLSGGVLSLRYRSAGPAATAVIDLKPATAPADAGLIPTQIFTHFADTGGREEEIRLTLPATPGLTQVKEVVILHGPGTAPRPVDLAIARFECMPAKGGVRAPIGDH
jgi:hypothetical protein